MPNLPAVGVPPTGAANVLEGQLGSGSFNGFSWGPGTSCVISQISGVSDLPGIMSYDLQRGLDHGEWQGIDLAQGRDITLEFLIRGNLALSGDAALFQDALNTLAKLKNAFVPQNLLLPTAGESPIRLFNSTRFVYVRVRKRSPVYEGGFLQPYFRVAVLLHATDPRIYDIVTQSFSASLTPTPNAGRTYNKVYNLQYGGNPGATPITCVNNGNFPARGKATIYGPLTGPKITNTSTGQGVLFNITLGSSDILSVDFDTHTVILNGSASRRNTLDQGSTWWEILPGTNIIQFTASSSPGGAGRMNFSFNSAWI